LAHAGGLVVVPDGSSGTTMIASPADFHGTPWAPRSLAPKLGEHTREVLAQLGKSDAAIDELLTAGVATQAIDQD
jgi:crotonobetainyl-CoA:carnitine CoA-transferase CaiB-like acyl-CoA transferase